MHTNELQKSESWWPLCKSSAKIQNTVSNTPKARYSYQVPGTWYRYYEYLCVTPYYNPAIGVFPFCSVDSPARTRTFPVFYVRRYSDVTMPDLLACSRVLLLGLTKFLFSTLLVFNRIGPWPFRRPPIFTYMWRFIRCDNGTVFLSECGADLRGRCLKGFGYAIIQPFRFLCLQSRRVYNIPIQTTETC